ncbi:tumor necrosis factor receptor superfamily member 16-like isoform X2 [Sinocyclocheilus rhinocerous]|uniref:tumor necrosis factor receptor superfamily member 16-like isoform X2 n=1 Tax=Sinocyclocheilus rhinocerous TaxID=307959 RepID=UPI0007B8AE30|nr:PREDICTED: tumor necrosis factor receptor superfamily member 16-like isoform X2 [Sinocyclocheilus rhinocerous]
MLTLTVVFLLVGKVLSTQNSCPSGAFTTSGECCKQCQPGEGMVKPCGATQTVCEPCLDSETFSENFSHTEQCQPCTPCSELTRMLTPCTDANDAVCVCDYGFFFSKVTSRCEACTVCPVGQGVLMRCNFDLDTVCEECVDDTYSDQETSFDPCMPCAVCDQPEMELKSCTPFSDAVCQDVLYTAKSPPDSPTESVTTADPGLKRLHGLSDNLIPIYTSILAAVLLGLVAFIIFKRWNSCKQNKQGANNRACSANPSQTPSPEGEKLHSDSGISVDSQSLQEGQGPPHTVVKIDGGSALSLPLHTREEVEKLLNHTCEGEESGANEETDWCSLAGLLGYKEEHIANFKQEERPIQALLSHWASQDSANIDTLCTALKKINREDIAQSITVKPTATSTV